MNSSLSKLSFNVLFLFSSLFVITTVYANDSISGCWSFGYPGSGTRIESIIITDHNGSISFKTKLCVSDYSEKKYTWKGTYKNGVLEASTSCTLIDSLGGERYTQNKTFNLTAKKKPNTTLYGVVIIRVEEKGFETKEKIRNVEFVQCSNCCD